MAQYLGKIVNYELSPCGEGRSTLKVLITVPKPGTEITLSEEGPDTDLQHKYPLSITNTITTSPGFQAIHV